MNQEFVLFDHLSSSLTDFRPERVGKWNKADPSYVPQYCAFFLLLADEKIEQTRGSDDVSIFSLFSSWGASTFFFYVVFAVLSYWLSKSHVVSAVHTRSRCVPASVDVHCVA